MFNQWVKDHSRLGNNPNTVNFPVPTIDDLLRTVKAHKLFINRPDTISLTAKPDNLTKDTKWGDCDPSFSNYL